MNGVELLRTLILLERRRQKRYWPIAENKPQPYFDPWFDLAVVFSAASSPVALAEPIDFQSDISFIYTRVCFNLSLYALMTLCNKPTFFYVDVHTKLVLSVFAAVFNFDFLSKQVPSYDDFHLRINFADFPNWARQLMNNVDGGKLREKQTSLEMIRLYVKKMNFLCFDTTLAPLSLSWTVACVKFD